MAYCILERKTASEGDAGPLPVRTPESEEPGFELARGSSLRGASKDDSRQEKASNGIER